MMQHFQLKFENNTFQKVVTGQQKAVKASVTRNSWRNILQLIRIIGSGQ